MTDPNQHVREYLGHFLSLRHPPHYAVLLDGPWGIGKTFLVRKLLEQRFGDRLPENGRYVMVSLFGLRTAEEIDEALVAALHPALGSAAVGVVRRLAVAGMKMFRFDPELKSTDFVDKFKADLFVFDDLERCSMPVEEALGYINEFVEHRGAKVVIVANTKEITDGEEFRRRREKLIGKALVMQSAVAEALDHFIGLLADEKARAVIASLKDRVRAIYEQAGLNNLRILQQSLWELERFLAALEDRHRSNAEAMKRCVELILPLALEEKAGRITEADIRARRGVGLLVLARGKDAEATAMAVAMDRYPDLSLADTTVEDDQLVDLLVQGMVDAKVIRRVIDRSRFFGHELEESAWVTVWNSFDRADEDVERAIAESERQLSAREIEDPRVLAHMFGLRLRLASAKLIERTRAEVVREGRKYVDDVYAVGRLQPLERDDPDELDGSGGMAVAEREAKDFQCLRDHLLAACRKALVDTFPAKAAVLLDEMKRDAVLFHRRVTHTNSEDNIYHDVPVLASCDPREFASTLLSLHPSSQWVIFRALSNRYKRGALAGDLKSERPWLRGVRKEILAGLPGSAVARQRLLQLVNSAIPASLVAVPKRPKKAKPNAGPGPAAGGP